MHHITHRQQIIGAACLASAIAFGIDGARPCHILGKDQMRLRVMIQTFDPDARALPIDLQHHGDRPARDIACYGGLGQGLAPCSLISQKLGRKSRGRATPQAAIAVIAFQGAAQRDLGHALQAFIHARTHRIAARQELALAILRRKLAADLIGEIVARRHGGAEWLDMAALDSFKRRGLRTLHFSARDIAVFIHLAQHIVAATDGAIVIAHRVKIRRRLRQRGQIGRLFQRQRFEIGVEVGLGRRSHAIGILAKEDLVEIKLKDAFLAQRGFDPGGKDDLAHLALDRARPVEQEVLHHLLGDGRGAAHIAPARADSLDKGRRNGARIIAAVLIEIAIFRRNKGMGHQIGDFLGRHEQAALGGEFIHDHPFARINPADRGGRVIGQGVMAGQVMGIDVKHAAHGHGDCDRAKGHSAEDRAEKANCESDHAISPPVMAIV